MSKINIEAMGTMAAAGFTLIPLHKWDKMILRGRPGKQKMVQAGKAPVDNNWTERAYDAQEVLDRAKAGGINLGVRLTACQVVVDVDPRHFPEGETLDTDNPLHRLEADCAFSYQDFPHVVTGSGGLHIYMAKPDELPVLDGLPDYPGVEFKSKGRQVVAPGSIHPDAQRPYVLVDTWSELSALPECPQSLSDRIRRPDIKAKASEPSRRAQGEPGEVSEGSLDAEQADLILSMFEIPGGEGNYGDWLKVLMALHHCSGGNGEVLDACISWSEGDANVEDKWRGFGQYAGPSVGFGTITHIARQYCMPSKQAQLETIIAGINGENAFADAEDPGLGDTVTDGVGEPDQKLPSIRVRDGFQADIVDQATSALMDRYSSVILQRGAELVRPLVTNATESVEGVRFNAGSTVLHPVKANWLWLQMSKSADWYRMTQQTPEKGGGLKATRTDPPKKIAAMIMEDQGNLPFHTVVSMVAAPTIDVATGEVIDTPGINPKTGLLAVFAKDAFPKVQRDVGHEGAIERLEMVAHDLLRGFPFEDGPTGPSASVAMSAMITGLLRPTMRSAPLHGFDAALPGSGKSKLAELAGILATGVEPAASSWARNEEENEKRIGAMLRTASPVVLFDNLEVKNGDKLEGNKLNMALTSNQVQIRVLGHSEMENLSTRVLFLATGNNLTTSGDMVRRVVKCRLDAKVAEPEKRKFDWDPVDVAKADRGKYVAAILEAVSAYIQAGRPCNPDGNEGAWEVEKVGSFEAWATVQGVLVWCGFDDPARTMADVKATDTDRVQLEQALEAWVMAFGSEWVDASDIADLLKSMTDDLESLTGMEFFDDMEAIRETLLDGKDTKNWIGKSLRNLGGVACGSYYLEVLPEKRGAKARVTMSA